MTPEQVSGWHFECDDCGIFYVEWYCSDDDWAEVMGEPHTEEVLCLTCFTWRGDHKKGWWLTRDAHYPGVPND